VIAALDAPVLHLLARANKKFCGPYLRVGQGNQAAAKFQKIIDHRGLVGNYPLSALAHLQLGRAYALTLSS
jgi:hypothetical protein